VHPKFKERGRKEIQRKKVDYRKRLEEFETAGFLRKNQVADKERSTFDEG